MREHHFLIGCAILFAIAFSGLPALIAAVSVVILVCGVVAVGTLMGCILLIVISMARGIMP